MRTCPNCNGTITSEQRRCGNCGYALNPTHVSVRMTEPIHSPPPTYIPPPSPHPAPKPRLIPTDIGQLLPVPVGALLMAILLLAFIGVLVWALAR